MYGKGLNIEDDKHSLDIYLREIGKIPLLDYDSEYRLAKKSRLGDISARQRIIRANTR